MSSRTELAVEEVIKHDTRSVLYMCQRALYLQGWVEQLPVFLGTDNIYDRGLLQGQLSCRGP